jgi:phosphoserine phosphatase
VDASDQPGQEGVVVGFMPIFILVRPGRTDFDEQQRIQGTLDLPLNPAGLAQWDSLATDLSRMSVDRIHSSPGEPCHDMALRFAERLGVTIQTWDGFASRHEGLWQGLEVSALRHKSPRAFRQWEESPGQVCAPEGELFEKVVERVELVVSKISRKTGTMVIVAAEPVITIVSCLLRGVDPHTADFSDEVLGPCGWEVIEAWPGQPGVRLQRSSDNPDGTVVRGAAAG